MGRAVSIKKVEANRRNARRSTGPKTVKGKRAVRFNALKHGLWAKTVVIPMGRAKESEVEFKRLVRRLRRELEPRGIREEMQVERIAVAYWRKRRALRSEVGDIRKQVEAVERDDCGGLDPEAEGLWEPWERKALRHSAAGLDYLLGVLNETRRHVKRAGGLDEAQRERLRHCFGDAPDGFARRCLELAARATETPEEAAGADEGPQERPYKKRLIRLLDEEIATLTAEKAQLPPDASGADTAAIASCCVPTPDIVNRNLRYERALDRELDRAMAELERLQRRRALQPVRPSRPRELDGAR